MLDKRIKFDESHICKEHGTITLYFTAPKELLIGNYSDAEYAELSIECPKEYIDAKYSNVEISPVMYDEKSEKYIYYDWRDIELPYEEIEELIKLAEEKGGM